MIAHYHEKVQGYFDFADVYSFAIERARDGDTIVEVGCWKGKSLSYLLVEAANSGKDLRIVGVDHFQGSIDQPTMMIEGRLGRVREQCIRNCEQAGYPFELLEMPSVAAALTFADDSISFAFIDGSHDYNSVVADIDAWLPKVKLGGILAGHDIDEAGVYQATCDRLPDAKRVGRCWVWKVRAI